MTEQYNGWANRETWALQLNLTNDQGLYEWALEHVLPEVENDPNVSPMRVGQLVKDFAEWLIDECPGQAADCMRADVGSFWRVDVAELGEAWLESAREELANA